MTEGSGTGRSRSFGRVAFVALVALNLVTIAGLLALLLERYGPGTSTDGDAAPAMARADSPSMAENAVAAAAPQGGDRLSPPVASTLPMTDNRTIGDWLYRCWEFPGTVGVKCSVVQQVIEESSKAVLLRWTIGQDENGGLIGEWLTPTSVFVDRGITLADITEKPVRLPFSSCGAGYCRAVANLAPDFVRSLGSAERISVTYYPVDGGDRTLSPVTNGLSGALALMGEPTP